jgi:hypothetical protein
VRTTIGTERRERGQKTETQKIESLLKSQVDIMKGNLGKNALEKKELRHCEAASASARGGRGNLFVLNPIRIAVSRFTRLEMTEAIDFFKILFLFFLSKTHKFHFL